jgi:hypothetical protein
LTDTLTSTKLMKPLVVAISFVFPVAKAGSIPSFFVLRLA